MSIKIARRADPNRCGSETHGRRAHPEWRPFAVPTARGHPSRAARSIAARDRSTSASVVAQEETLMRIAT